MLLQLIVSAFALHLASALLPDHLRLKQASQDESSDESSDESLEVGEIFRDKCLINGTDQSKFVMNQAYAAKEDLEDCFYSLFNYTVFLEEVKQSKQGDLHLVFTKYCKHVDTFQPYLDDFLTILEPCLNEGVLESVHNMREAFNAHKDLLCRKEANVTGQFIQDGGLECISVTYVDILRCYQDTLSCHMSKYKFGEEECRGVKAFKTCTLKKLTPCGDRALHYVDAIMTSVWEASMCFPSTDNGTPQLAGMIRNALEAATKRSMTEAWTLQPTSEEEEGEDDKKIAKNCTIDTLELELGTVPTDYSVLQLMIIPLILALLAYSVCKVSTCVKSMKS